MGVCDAPRKEGFYWARIPTRSEEFTHIVRIMGVAPYLHFMVWDTQTGATAKGCAPCEIGIEVGKRIKEPKEEGTA